MAANLSSAATKLMKHMFKDSETSGKDIYLPNIN
jgi:hypothetical protein